MSAVTWLPVGNANPKELSEARHQVHNAAQWLARAAHSYMRPQPEHAHTWLRWDGQSRALVTQEFLPKLTLELKPADLTLQFREDGKAAPHIIELDDRTPAEVEAWMLVELLHRRLDRDRFSKALPYEIPNLMTGDAIPYMSENLRTALAEVSAWLANGASVLTRIAEECFPGGSVWCWPEAFHVVLLPPARTDASPSRPLVRAGLALGGANSGEPYFYVTPRDPGSALTAASLLSSEQPASRVLEFLRAEIAVRQLSDR